MKTYTIEFFSVRHFKFTFQCQSVPFELRAIPEEKRFSEFTRKEKFIIIHIKDHEFDFQQIDFMNRIENQFLSKECKRFNLKEYCWAEYGYFILREEEFQVLL